MAFQDRLCNFTNSSLAAVTAQHPIRLTSHSGASIRGSDQQIDLLPDSKIVEIVADKAGVLLSDTQIGLKFCKCPWFVFDSNKAITNS